MPTFDSPAESAISDPPLPTRDWVVQRTAKIVRRSASTVLDLIFPPACHLCWQDMEVPGEVHFCGRCRLLLRTGKTLCLACAMPLPKLASPGTGQCPACQDQRFWFSNVVAVGLYEGLLRDVVLRMKKSHEEALTLTMGRMLAESLRSAHSSRPTKASESPSMDTPTPELVVPVPMHWTRRIARGTNPAEVLAEIVGQKLRIPIANDLLKNRRKTMKQGMLLPDQRRRNVRQAFSVSAGYDIKDTSVLLIDDVMTTGATCNELSKILRRSGARSVSVAVVARGTG